MFAPFSLEFNLTIKLAPKFKDFPAPTAIFKDFHGLEFFFFNSTTVKMRANPDNNIRRDTVSMLK